jgi:hypothetical protein
LYIFSARQKTFRRAHHTKKIDEDDGRTRHGEPAARARLSLGVARQGESVAGIILGGTYSIFMLAVLDKK